MMRSFELRVAHLLKIEGTIQQVTILADKYFAGLSSLMDGNVSMDLVSSKVAKREIEDLKTMAFLSRFELVSQNFAQIYQLPGSYMDKEGVISVVVDIPIVPITDYGKFALYKYDSLLFLLDGRLVKVQGESNMVAVSANKDEFVEVSGSDLHSCLHIGSVFLCHYLGVKILASFLCCLCDIFTGKTRAVMRDCDLTFLSERFWLDCINSTVFLYYANSSRSEFCLVVFPKNS